MTDRMPQTSKNEPMFNHIPLVYVQIVALFQSDLQLTFEELWTLHKTQSRIFPEVLALHHEVEPAGSLEALLDPDAKASSTALFFNRVQNLTLSIRHSMVSVEWNLLGNIPYPHYDNISSKLISSLAGIQTHAAYCGLRYTLEESSSETSPLEMIDSQYFPKVITDKGELRSYAATYPLNDESEYELSLTRPTAETWLLTTTGFRSVGDIFKDSLDQLHNDMTEAFSRLITPSAKSHWGYNRK